MTSRQRAYARASRALETSGVDIEETVRVEHHYFDPGIGKAQPGVSRSLPARHQVNSGAEEITPPGLLDMLKIRGLGAKKVRAIYISLGIRHWGILKRLVEGNQVAALPGFGAKSQEDPSEGIEELRRNEESRIPHRHGDDRGRSTASVDCGSPFGLAFGCRGAPASRSRGVRVASSSSSPRPSRRRTRTSCENRRRLDHREHDGDRTPASPTARIAVKIYVSDRPADYFVALHQHTGAHDYCFMLSIPLHDRGYDLRDGALYRDGEPVELRSEEELFELSRYAVPCIPPEIREGVDEVPCTGGPLPGAYCRTGYSRIMHVHSTLSDGQNTVAEMADHARSLGYSYLLMCDHSKAASYANGLDERRLEAQGREIDELNKQYDPTEFRVLKGIECDILADGSMDFDDDVLATLDAVVASIHSSFNLPMEAQTERLCSALRNRYVTILGHPTGRLLLKRKGYDVDLRWVINCAAASGQIDRTERQPAPARPELADDPIRAAQGVKIAINPDAHSTAGFGVMRYGVKIGRKGMADAGRFVECVEWGRGGGVCEGGSFCYWFFVIGCLKEWLGSV